MANNELINHYLELSLKLDQLSAQKDYEGLRKLHHDNINWMNENGLTDDYYQVFFNHLQEEN